MASFSKLMNHGSQVHPSISRRLEQLLRNPPTRRSLLIIFASILIVRGAVLHHDKSSQKARSSKKGKATGSSLQKREREQHSSDAQFFRLNPSHAAPAPNGSLPAHSRPKSVPNTFIYQLRSLLRIVIPSLRSKEALILAAHSCFLVLRTVLSIAVARLDGKIVRDLVSADGYGFIRGLGLWFALAVPSVYTNSMVRLCRVYLVYYKQPNSPCFCTSTLYRSDISNQSSH